MMRAKAVIMWKEGDGGIPKILKSWALLGHVPAWGWGQSVPLHSYLLWGFLPSQAGRCDIFTMPKSHLQPYGGSVGGRAATVGNSRLAGSDDG